MRPCLLLEEVPLTRNSGRNSFCTTPLAVGYMNVCEVKLVAHHAGVPWFLCCEVLASRLSEVATSGAALVQYHAYGAKGPATNHSWRGMQAGAGTLADDWEHQTAGKV